MAALEAGWDLIVPGTGYDLSLGQGRPPTCAVVVAGPTGRLSPAAIVSADETTGRPDTTPTSFLIYVPEVDQGDDGLMYEVTFHCEPSESLTYLTYDIDIVSPESDWGVPDFREPTHGWASWLGDELIVAWSEAGNDDQGAKRLTLEEIARGPGDAGFLVALARAIIVARVLDDGL